MQQHCKVDKNDKLMHVLSYKIKSLYMYILSFRSSKLALKKIINWGFQDDADK